MTTPVDVQKEVLVPETMMPDMRATGRVDVGKVIFIPETVTVTPGISATDLTGSRLSEAFSSPS